MYVAASISAGQLCGALHADKTAGALPQGGWPCAGGQCVICDSPLWQRWQPSRLPEQEQLHSRWSVPSESQSKQKVIGHALSPSLMSGVC